MKIFLNPGHSKDYESGAVNQNTGLREADVVWNVGVLLEQYLNNVGIETTVLQSDNLYYDSPYGEPCVIEEANSGDYDLFISLHCNAFNNGVAKGTETLVYSFGGTSEKLAECIQKQIIDTFHTVDRGLKERPGLLVLSKTDMPAVLVEMAFIDNEDDEKLLANNQDDFARAIARGVTDYMNL